MHEESALQCNAPDEHGKAHAISTCKGDFSWKHMVSDLQLQLDHGTTLGMSRRRANRTLVHEGSLHRHRLTRRGPRDGDLKLQRSLPIQRDGHYRGYVKGRGPCPRINFGAKWRKVQVRKSNPLSPPDKGKTGVARLSLVTLLQGGRLRTTRTPKMYAIPHVRNIVPRRNGYLEEGGLAPRAKGCGSCPPFRAHLSHLLTGVGG